MKQVSLQDARDSLPELVDAAVGGEEVVLLSDQQRPAVRLVPIAPSAGRPQFGSARGKITIADDFDAPIPGFEPYGK